MAVWRRAAKTLISFCHSLWSHFRNWCLCSTFRLTRWKFCATTDCLSNCLLLHGSWFQRGQKSPAWKSRLFLNCQDKLVKAKLMGNKFYFAFIKLQKSLHPICLSRLSRYVLKCCNSRGECGLYVARAESFCKIFLQKRRIGGRKEEERTR